MSDYVIWKLLYGGDTRKIKKYFHVLYEGGRRTYGGAGRNSLDDVGNKKKVLKAKEAQIKKIKGSTKKKNTNNKTRTVSSRTTCKRCNLDQRLIKKKFYTNRKVYLKRH